MQQQPLRGVRLSPYQRRLWRLHPSDATSPYRSQVAVGIAGPLELDRLRHAVRDAAAEHEILRTAFEQVAGVKVPLQVVTVGAPMLRDRRDVAPVDPAERRRWLRSLLAADRERPMDASEGPLRAAVVALGPDDHVLVLSSIALCGDRKSMLKLARGIADRYGLAAAGDDPMQYSDFSAWHNEVLESADPTDRAFWAVPAAEPVDVSAIAAVVAGDRKGAVSAFRPELVEIEVPDALSRRIALACAERGVGLDRFLIGCWAALLARITGQDRMIVGAPVDFHGYEELEHTIGLLTVCAPLSVPLDRRRSFTEMIEGVDRSLDDLAAHQEYFVADRPVADDASGAVPLPFCFEFAEAPPAMIVAGLQFAYSDSYACISDFTLNLVCVRSGDALTVDLLYDDAVIERSRAEEIGARLLQLLDSVMASPGATVGELDVLTAQDRHRLLVELNDTSTEHPVDECLHELFERQVERIPEAVALRFESLALTYAELNARANQLAHHLRGLGVGPDVVVPVCLHRSLDMLVAVLGVMKAGAAYAPLEPSDPPERVGLLLKNLRAPLLLTEQALTERFADAGIRLLAVDGDAPTWSGQATGNPSSGVGPKHLAYVIHTSGSTGRPKGVMIPHEGLTNYLGWAAREYESPVQGGTVVHSGFGVDLTVTSLFAALLAGQSVTMLPDERSFGALPDALRAESFAIVKATPGQVQLLNRMLTPLEMAGRAGVLVIGGEQLNAEDVAPWREHAPTTRIINEYGPTETVVGCCFYEIPPDAVGSGAVPIGRPIANARLYVLDERLQPVPPGVPGELYIGGRCVGRGYLGQPGLTAGRFVPDCFSGDAGARLYRTGDLVRLRPDDNLEFIGRTDHQVKIRGYRVEPGEVQQALARYPGVRQAAVMAHDDRLGGKRLVAYLAVDRADRSGAASSELRTFAARLLPEHMVPAAFVLLDALPLTSSGKVDLAALPDPDADEGERRSDYTAPRTNEEEVLAAIWADVLRLERVGIDDNYFVLGGDSIRSLQVVARARRRGLEFSMEQLFGNPTIRQIAHVLRRGAAGADTAASTLPFALVSARDRARMPEDVEDAYPLTMLQGGMLFHRAANPETTVYHDIFSLHLETRLAVDVLRLVIQQLIARHPALRTSFDIANFSEPLQLVHRVFRVPLEIADLCDRSTEAQDAEISAWIARDQTRGFDPTDHPLVRFQVHARTERSFQFSGSFHHAIIDGWSDAVMVTEIFEHYLSALQGDVVALAPPAAVFRDFVALERAAVRAAEQREYWDGALDGHTRSELPPRAPDHGTGPTRSSDRRVVSQLVVPVPDEVAAGLTRLALSSTLPLKSVLLAAHLKVLSLLSGQSDVLTCVVSSGRLEDTDGERALGLFLNSVPFRLAVGRGSWRELALRCFAAEQEMLPFRRYPMAELQRRHGGKPLSDTLFYFTNYHVYQSLQRFDATLLDATFHEESSFPLIANFRLDPFAGTLLLDLQGDERLVSPAQLQAIGGYYQRALAAAAAAPDGPVSGSVLLSVTETTAQCMTWNPTAPARDEVAFDEPGVVERVALHAARAPEHTAVTCGMERWSYARLDARSRAIAVALRAAGIGPESVVGVCLERTPELVAALLGVWRAGAAYVPLDPSYPVGRLSYMLADSGARVVLTERVLADRLTTSNAAPLVVPELICLDDVDDVSSPGDDRPADTGRHSLAYVIYTSGSTGAPKGIAIEHHSLDNLLAWAREAYGASELGGVLAATSVCFDLSLFELFAPLTAGGTVILAGDALALPTLPAREEVRLVNTVPSVLAELLQHPSGLPSGIETVNLAGEPLRRGLVAAIEAIGITRVLDLYGPSETTTYATGGPRTGDGPETIGRPLRATTLYIMDAAGALLPAGVMGEIHLGGEGVARGYVGRPALTAERFVPDPFSAVPGARLYRTGDRGRYLADGRIEFLGRADEQVKLRGFRIELGEVTAALARVPGVREAVAVVVGEDAHTGAQRDVDARSEVTTTADRRRLVGYVATGPSGSVGDAVASTVTPSSEPSAADIRRALAAVLPGHLVPSQIVVLPALPHMPNGKVDKRALRAVHEDGRGRDERFAAPRTPLEVTLAEIWQTVLGVERVGLHDSFVDLGGHSLLAVQVAAQLKARTGLVLDPSKLMVQTLGQLATASLNRSSPTGL